MLSVARTAQLAAASVVVALAVTGCAAQVGGHVARANAPAPVVAPPAAPDRASTAPARAARVSTPCATNRIARFVYVSVRLQHMWMCARHRLVYETPVTTGMAHPDTRTPTGTFRIQGLNRNTTLTPSTGETYPVKYWIPFQAPLFGFHDSPWQRFPYGSPKYRTDGSHGCVHMPLAAIRFLYRWADIGTTVRIQP